MTLRPRPSTCRYSSTAMGRTHGRRGPPIGTTMSPALPLHSRRPRESRRQTSPLNSRAMSHPPRLSPRPLISPLPSRPSSSAVCLLLGAVLGECSCEERACAYHVINVSMSPLGCLASLQYYSLQGLLRRVFRGKFILVFRTISEDELLW